ncbi:DNA-methyltransferase [Peptoniphilaceae bacterium SGI.131]
MKSDKNKTIDFDLEKGQAYAAKALKSLQGLDFNDLINKSILGDSLSVLDSIPDKTMDLIIVDPPYNLSKNYHGNTFSQKSQVKYLDYTRTWLEKVGAKLKDTGSLYVCCDWYSSIVIGQVLSDYFIIRNRITWQREKGRGAKKNWKNSMEDIWFVTKSDTYTFNVDAVKLKRRVIAPYKKDGKPKDWEATEFGNFRDTFPSNFWDDITIPFWSMPENTAHPTQKPEKLIAKLILASSNPKDLVLDPFMGSGTTCVVAKKLGRNYIGIEQNPLYVAWAEKRLEDAEKDGHIQGYDEGVFWERNTNR